MGIEGERGRSENNCVGSGVTRRECCARFRPRTAVTCVICVAHQASARRGKRSPAPRGPQRLDAFGHDFMVHGHEHHIAGRSGFFRRHVRNRRTPRDGRADGNVGFERQYPAARPHPARQIDRRQKPAAARMAVDIDVRLLARGRENRANAPEVASRSPRARRDLATPTVPQVALRSRHPRPFRCGRSICEGDRCPWRALIPARKENNLHAEPRRRGEEVKGRSTTETRTREGRARKGE